MKTLNIYVTQEDICDGTKGGVHTCAIARAFTRMFDGIKIQVLSTHLVINNDTDDYFNIPLPDIAVGFIKLFDVSSHNFASPIHIPFEIPDDIYDKYFSCNVSGPKEKAESIPVISQQDKSVDLVREA